MLSSDTTLKKTPLYEEHLSLQAKMVGFGGWDMPLQYKGILDEYQATRRSIGIFDTSHMGEFLVEGEAGKSGLDRLVTCTIDAMPIKTCRYGLLLNERAGTIDDLIVFRLSKERWFIVVNAGTTPKDA